jgi:hypothetical protein
MRRAEGGAKIFGVFRVENHDFTPKNRICSNGEGGAKFVWVFRVKNHDFTPKIIFFQILGGCAPPLDPPLHMGTLVAKLRSLSGVPFKWCPGHVPYLPYPIYATVHSKLVRKSKTKFIYLCYMILVSPTMSQVISRFQIKQECV